MMSERGRGNVRNTKSHEEGWTTVDRRRRRSDDRNVSNVHVRVPKNNNRESREKGGFSIFIDNLPAFYDNRLLRKLFSNMGKIKDSYMPWRRRFKIETRFGFVSFEREGDAMKAIKCFNGIVIFRFKITVKESFENKKSAKSSSTNPIYQAFPSAGAGRTYAEVVAKGKEEWVVKTARIDTLKKKKDGETTRDIPICRCDFLEEKLREQGLLQENQEMRLKEIELMCLAFKNKLDSWNDRRRMGKEENIDHEFQDGNGLNEEEDMESKVPETEINDNVEKIFVGNEEQIDEVHGTKAHVAVNISGGRIAEEDGGERFFAATEKVEGSNTEKDISKSFSSRSIYQKPYKKGIHGIKKKF